MTSTPVYAAFSRPCLDCGHTVSVINGVEQPHTCEAPEDRRQLVARAYWQGHDAAAAPISPEAFMAQPPDPEEELEASAPDLGRLVQLPPDPLASIAESLSRLVEHYTADTRDGAEQCAHVDELAALQREFTELEALHDAKQALIDQALEVCSKSVSKLANSVREVLEPVVATSGPEPETAQGAEHPSHDAPVEEWREFARSIGYAGPDVDTMNRSQIRSMLGIDQPGTPVAPSVVHS